MRFKIKQNISRFPLSFLTFLYFLTWSPLILSFPAIYWDDWWWTFDQPDRIISGLSQLGHPWRGIILTHLLQFNPVIIHLFSFLSFLVSGLIFYKILVSIQIIFNTNYFEKLLLASVFLVAPLFPARHSLSVAWYSFSLLFFILASFLLLQSKKNQTNRFIILFLFFISFDTNSLLVFYIVPIFVHFLLVYKLICFQNILQYLKKYFSLVTLPFLYYVPKSLFFKPYGIDESYNVTHFNSYFFYLTLFSIISILVIINFISFLNKTNRKNYEDFLPLFIGLILSIIAIYPYLAVRNSDGILGFYKLSSDFFDGWHTRDQLLLIVALPFFILSFLRLSQNISKLLGFTVTLFIIFILAGLSFNFGTDYFRDYQKQNILIDYIKDNHSNPTVNFLFLDDRAKHFNIFERTYRVYEVTGFFRKATGDPGVGGIELKKSNLDFYHLCKDNPTQIDCVWINFSKPSEEVAILTIKDSCKNNRLLPLTRPSFCLALNLEYISSKKLKVN